MPPARPPRGTRPPAPPPRGPRRAAPVLARQVRGEIVESVHRGHVVRVDEAGRVTHVAGDAEVEVTLRSCVKPFALLALAEAGGFRDYGLTSAEIALMASSHSGEDLHVRTLQAVFRRSGLTQTLLACGTEGAPLDSLTSARLARDGERAGPIRHMCSGYHAAMLLLARLGDWSLEDYWNAGHPAQVAVRAAVALAFATTPERLITAVDNCGVETYVFPLASVARAYAFLADPDAVPAGDPRQGLAPPLPRDPRRDGRPPGDGGRDARTARHLAREGASGAPRRQGRGGGATGHGRPPGPGTAYGRVGDRAQGRGRRGPRPGDVGGEVEALRLAGVLEGQALRVVGRYHRPVELDPHGRIAAETIPGFDFAPVGELIG